MKCAFRLMGMLCVTPVLLQAGPAIADEPPLPGYVTQSIIDGHALSHVRGRFAVNMAAGDSNIQANAAAVALGANGPAIGLVGGIQATDPGQATLPDVAVAVIGAQVFANSSGLISVNQTSGVGNAQANGAAFALGFEEVVAGSGLSATTSNAGPAGAEDYGFVRGDAAAEAMEPKPYPGPPATSGGVSSGENGEGQCPPPVTVR
jgi:hypothetical protein